MLKRLIFLTYLLGSLFLVNAMQHINQSQQLALSTKEVLSLILQITIREYYQEVVSNQSDIQHTFNNHYKEFNTNDVSLFFPKFPTHCYVNKEWYSLFKKELEKIQSFYAAEKTNIFLLTPYRYGPKITGVDDETLIKDVIGIHPWVYTTQEDLEKKITKDISSQEDRNNRLGYLKERIELYEKTFFNGQKKEKYNLLLLTAFELLSYNGHVCYLSYREFFYQLFFNSPLDNNLKRSFFNYLISYYPNRIFLDTIVDIVLDCHFNINPENKPFWELYDKLSFIPHRKTEFYHVNDDIKKQILIGSGFSPEEINKNEKQKNELLNKLKNTSKANATQQDLNELKKEFKSLLYSSSINNQSNEWYFLCYILKVLDEELPYSRKPMEFLNMAVFFLKNNLKVSSHEEIAQSLELARYTDLLSYNLEKNYINPHYTFTKETECESEKIKNPSLLLIKMLTGSLQPFPYSNVIESQTKEEIRKNYPDSIITNNKIIIFLLKKCFELDGYYHNKVLLCLKNLFEASQETTQMIKSDTNLFDNLKKHYFRLKESNYYPSIQAFIEELLPDLKEDSKETDQIVQQQKVDPIVQQPKDNKYVKFFKRNSMKILSALIAFGIVVTLLYKKRFPHFSAI